MNYPIKTLSQIPLILRGFRKVRGLTQAAMAERLGITQQSYAHFEANPSTATLERLFMVLRMLNVEISLDQADSTPSTQIAGEPAANTYTAGKQAKASAVTKPGRIAATARKKESW
ncbi:MAG: helix-turn-helix domain-containing protein [Rhodocyclaceae bacterium]|jgi:HTH-type transcriptional regulator/antitoxin HipB|nr:helix-turn-helix domain-containing protein [Rhodocyclaceae bacterium]